MTRIKPQSLAMMGCVAIAIWLVAAQLIASRILLIPCFVFFISFVIWATAKNLLIPVLLFFLPWTPLLKSAPGTTSIYTIALLVVLCVVFLWGSKNINAFHILPVLVLLALTLCVKLAYSYPIANNYILFFALLLVFPLITREMNRQYDFYELTIFFSMGIIIAALMARGLVQFPTIARYISIHTQLDYFRYCGFYGDPNFYSAHITAAMSGILLVILKGNKVRTQIFLTMLLVVLAYCGFMSVSKSFVLIFACIVLLGGMQMLVNRGKLTEKVITILAISMALAFMLSSTIFTDLIDLMIGRLFGSATNLSDFTTKRTDIWMNYFNEFESNPLLGLFGRGYTSVLINERASHNTVIQLIYQFGMIGSAIFVIWLWSYIKLALRSIKIKTKMLLPMGILFLGAFGPWMALDILFFDELFLVSFYVLLGMHYISSSHTGEEVI